MTEADAFRQMEKIENSSVAINEVDEPRLEAPGAGLPRLEGMLLKHMVVPLFAALTPWRLAVHLYLAEGNKALALAESASHQNLAKRILIPRLTAMEDSSRYWSVYMTLRHLILAGEVIEEIIIKSSHGEHSSKTLSIVNVKPELDTPATILEDFRKFLERFARNMSLPGAAHHSPLTHIHPWLGPLTMHQWLCLGGLHQRLHRRQIQLILRKQTRG